MTPGKFIAFEGGEGVGKSTQARLLAAALQERGVEVVLTREPGGTPGAEAIRALLLDPEGNDWSAPAEALLFAAARADHVEKLIRPALDSGKWVICDRFIDSTRAYQGGAGGLRDGDILDLHRVGTGGLLPDIAILLETTAGTARGRLEARDGANSDRIGGRNTAYHERVTTAFSRLAADTPDRFIVIIGEGDPAAVHASVLDAVLPLLDYT